MPSVFKTIHVLTDHTVGGAGVLLRRLLSHPILKEGSLVLLPTGSLLCASLAESGIAYATFPMKKSRSFSLASLGFFRDFFRESQPQLVVSHASLSARMAARLQGVPTLSVRHCDTPILRAGVPLYNALTDLTVATSSAAAMHLCRAGVRRVYVIENAATDVGRPTREMRNMARAALGIPHDQVAIGLVGRLAPIKGQKTALLALSRLSEAEKENFLLCFLGDGEEKASLMREAVRLGVMPLVRFFGYRDDPREFYHAMDAHISCSFGSETASLSLAEGMSAALPTLATDIPGNRERVRGGGLFFPVGDDAALARLFCRLLDGEQRARLSALAYARFRSLPTLAQMQAAYGALFDAFGRELGKDGCFFQKDMLQ